MSVELKRFYAPRRSLFGAGCVEEVGIEVAKLGAKKSLVVTDPGVLAAGLVEHVLEPLKREGLEVSVFSEVQPNPTDKNVAKGLERLNEFGAQAVIGLGGGSAIDAGKAIAALAANGGRLQDYDGVDLLKKRMLPYVAVNTTAGTGSEMSRAAVITDTAQSWKMQIVDECVTPDVAIDDPMLTLSLPPGPTAQTGMDALTHAIEALVCRGHSPISDGMALQAIRLIYRNLPIAFGDGRDLEARNAMMYGQASAGLAFTNGGVGNVHAMAHQLGAIFDLPHGLANAILLPYVMEFNVPVCKKPFALAAKAMGGDELAGLSVATLAALACSMVVGLNMEMGIPARVNEIGIKEGDLPLLVDKSMADGCITLNPRATSKTDMEELWRRAYYGEFNEQTLDGMSLLRTL
jgi:alcohol dehydrogenase